MIKTMNFRLGISGLLFISQGLISIAWAGVSGTVYQDLPVNGTTLNTYGVKDANERGVEGITVTAYPDGLSTTTANDGTWSLATTGDVRLEFSGWSSYLQESAGTSDSSVQFISDGQTANFALHNPTDFVAANPSLATTHFVNGQETPVSGALPTLFAWPYANSGLIDPNQQTLADTSTARSLWGLTHSRSSNMLYSSTALRRHVSIGSNGLGAIYRTDLATNTTALFMSIPDAGSMGDDASRGLGAENTGNRDVEGFAKVGKVGLGDIELSDDESTLYVMNLFNKSIYEVDVDSATVTKSYAAPVASCVDGEARPFALQYYQGDLYVGSVCDASTATCDTSNFGQCSQLTAHIHKIPSGATTGNEVLSFRLDYEKDPVTNNGLYEGSARFWNPWTDVYSDLVINNGDIRLSHPVPILSNIKFDEYGNMLLAFSDRTGLQGGASNLTVDGAFERYAYSGGDILKATHNGNGSFSAPDVTFYDDNTDVSYHEEGALGAITTILGSNEVVFTQYDNVDAAVHTKGVTFLSTNDGSKLDAYRVADADRPTFFGKATGIGDLEILTIPAPIEIGDRVWDDSNSNGVQDASEAGIAGVTVELRSGTTTLATATTDANGYYIFSNDPNGTSTASHRYNITSLTADSAYIVRIPNVTGGSKQASLGVNNLTTSNSGEGTQTDSNDSDGVVSGDHAEATILATDIPYAGANNHRFDFGFRNTPTSNPQIDLQVSKTVSPTRVNSGEQATYTITVINNGTDTATNVQVTEQLPNGLSYVSDNPSQGTYDNNSGIWTVGDLANGASATLTIEVRAD